MHKDFERLHDILQDFQNHVLAPDWLTVWDDEELFEPVMEIMQAIIEGAVLVDIPDSVKKNIVGQLAMGHIYIAHAYGHEELYSEYERATQLFEKGLHELLDQKNWLTAAQNRFEKFVEYQEKLEREEEDLAREKTDYLRPVFLAFSLASLVTLPMDYEEGEEEEEDECCDAD